MMCYKEFGVFVNNLIPKDKSIGFIALRHYHTTQAFFTICPEFDDYHHDENDAQTEILVYDYYKQLKQSHPGSTAPLSPGLFRVHQIFDKCMQQGHPYLC